MMENNMNVEKLPYVSPELKVVTLRVERGFAASNVELKSWLVDAETQAMERYTEKNYGAGQDFWGTF